jgi:hypothetical protein
MLTVSIAVFAGVGVMLLIEPKWITNHWYHWMKWWND